MKTAIKTKTAPVTFKRGAERVTCSYYGDKDPWGKAIWYDADGKSYELSYARLAKTYAFIPYTIHEL